MLAARYLGPNRIEPLEVEKPRVLEEQALIRVEACGFCGSDIGIVAGVHPRAKEPLTLGHEFCGTIAEIQSSRADLQFGDRVTAFPLISCGTCFACTNGLSHVCRMLNLYGFDADGAMAEYVCLPVDSLLKLPAYMSPTVGAVIEPLAVAVHGVSLSPIENAKTVVVLGAGPIGLLTALVSRDKGAATVLISDVLPFRLNLARRLGLRAVAAGPELEKAVASVTANNGADIVFECVGSPATASAMTSIVRSRGVIVNLGVFKKPVAVDMQAINFKEIELRGSRVYTRADFASAIVLAQKLPVQEIVTHSFALKDVGAAFDYFKRGNDVCKVIILPNGAETGNGLSL
jgi:(R,R)-butanediol dehydrogenase / meso-butanediol dehydrogenase / diacetyl reductase